jgi:alkanesulfonate monooxygenase SsuD/methylene tetrahydromethanopterin reductase-like flavin-dependent oxidoreductase (luciferase family)
VERYQGRHYQLVRPLNSPNSVQRPHPPILIGGSGERKTMRLGARYAGACNLSDLPGTEFADNIAGKLRVLREHCVAAGRDYAEIEAIGSILPDMHAVEPRASLA